LGELATPFDRVEPKKLVAVPGLICLIMPPWDTCPMRTRVKSSRAVVDHASIINPPLQRSVKRYTHGMAAVKKSAANLNMMSRVQIINIIANIVERLESNTLKITHVRLFAMGKIRRARAARRA
jgi:hypothetical protein